MHVTGKKSKCGKVLTTLGLGCECETLLSSSFHVPGVFEHFHNRKLENGWHVRWRYKLWRKVKHGKGTGLGNGGGRSFLIQWSRNVSARTSHQNQDHVDVCGRSRGSRGNSEYRGGTCLAHPGASVVQEGCGGSERGHRVSDL